MISSTGVSDSEFVSERIKESATRWVVGNIAGTGSPDALVYSPHTSAKVFGVSEIDIIDSYTWTAGAYGGDGVYSYQWQIKLGTEPWDNLIGQTGWSYTRPVGIGHPDFQLRIQVTTFGEIVYGTKTIDVLICDPEEDEDCNA